MTKATIAGAVAITVLVLLALAVADRALQPDEEQAAPTPPASAPANAAAEVQVHPGLLYGRITARDGSTYEGRLRFGEGEEAAWGDYFNGAKDENPWVAHVPPERRPRESNPIELFGVTLVRRERPTDLRRLFMARFGDIVRVEAHGTDVRVTLKSGSVFNLQRLEASDFDDGVRVWDSRRGVVDLDSMQVRTIEFLPAAGGAAVPGRLHGTVRTGQGEFTGFVQWDREEGLGSDELDGRTPDGELHLRFDTLRSIARRSHGSSVVTLLDGREIVLSDTPEVGEGNRGIYVDDPRYGRVLVSWDAFERLDFSPGGHGPSYGDFPPGRPLAGGVTTRAGRHLVGRLVFDLDESETTETLDAPYKGVDYTLPFGRIASIVSPRGDPRVRVTLHDGEELGLEREGDLGERNAGMLIFVEGKARPEYVPWAEVEQIDFTVAPSLRNPQLPE